MTPRKNLNRMTDNLDKLFASGTLQCPSCTGTLRLENTLTCSACHQSFPQVADIPVLMPDPDMWIGLWQNRFKNYVAAQKHNIETNVQRINSGTLYPPLRDRLKDITQARADNLQTIVELMAPQRELPPGRAPENNTDTVGSFMLMTYLLRDWGWDTGEVDILCDQVIDALPEDLRPDSILVLGSGACRDAYNLHRHYNSKRTVCVDIAPLMLLGARHIISGGIMDLHHIQPNNVRNAADSAKRWTLKAPAVPDNEFLLTLADATSLPFRDDSFELVLTPFLIDAVGEDLRDFAPRIAKLIQPGGYWVNYGAMSFRPTISYTAEEVLDIVSSAGFRIIEHGFSTKAHLAAAESCQHTVYECLYFSAIRERA